MAKLDKSQYTKEEWKRIRNERRRQKELSRREKELKELTKVNPQTGDSNRKLNIVCLKHGIKYSADFVNKLYNMCRRHSNLEWNFYCLTDDSNGILPPVQILELPNYLSGWWCKPYIYSRDIPIEGDILYIDLDVVIASNFDHLWSYKPNNWCVIRDFTRSMQPDWKKYNSSVIRFKKGQLNHVWEEFNKNPQQVIGSYFGDQDWLWAKTQGTAELWPDQWIRSYKWEIRKSKQLTAGTKGNRRFMEIDNEARPNDDCCIAVFHGDPNPNMVDDLWVKQNWK